MLMEPQQYNRKPQPVWAMQFDGSTAGAYRLLGWLLGLRGTSGHFRSGYETQGPDGPVVVDQDGRDRFVLESEWVVVAQNGGTTVLRAQAFAEEYEAAPQAVTVGVLGHSHKPGCRCLRTRGNLRSECPELDSLQHTSVATSREDG